MQPVLGPWVACCDLERAAAHWDLVSATQVCMADMHQVGARQRYAVVHFVLAIVQVPDVSLTLNFAIS